MEHVDYCKERIRTLVKRMSIVSNYMSNSDNEVLIFRAIRIIAFLSLEIKILDKALDDGAYFFLTRKGYEDREEEINTLMDKYQHTNMDTPYFEYLGLKIDESVNIHGCITKMTKFCN